VAADDRVADGGRGRGGLGGGPVTAGRRRTGRRLIAAIANAVAAGLIVGGGTGLVGCGALAPTPGRLLLVWVDVSRSVRDVDALRAVYARALGAAAPGDRVVVAPIGAATMTQFRAAFDTVLPGTRLPRVLGALSTAQSRSAAEAARAGLVTRGLAVWDALMRQRASRSHILDAVEQSSTLIAPHRAAGGGPVELLFLTDGEETGARARLGRAGQRPAGGGQDTALDLAGAQVWLVGLTASSPSEYRARRDAWEATFRAAGGTVVPGRTGHTFLEVPFGSPPPLLGVPGRAP